MYLGIFMFKFQIDMWFGIGWLRVVIGNYLTLQRQYCWCLLLYFQLTPEQKLVNIMLEKPKLRIQFALQLYTN